MLFYYLQLLDNEEDKSKLTEIFLTYKQLMYYVANNVLNNNEDAEEAVSLTILTLIDKIDCIDEVKCNRTKAFVAIIAKRKAIDIYRKRNRHEIVELNENYHGIIDPNPIDEFEYSSLESLPPHYREVLIQKYQYGLSNEKIAEIHNSTPAAVRKMIWRAKVKLQEILDKEDE